MTPQYSDPEVVEREKQLVQRLTGGVPRLEEIGWTSRAYVVDGGRYVVMFPRTDEDRAEYEREIAILRLLDGVRFDVLVPRLRWVGDGNSHLGYEGIVGRQFDRFSEELDADRKRAIGRQIGGFVRTMHTFDLPGVPTFAVREVVENLHEKYALGLPVIQQHLGASELVRLKDFVQDEVPAELARLGCDAVLCHGDLGYWNIVLADDDRVGIIDFGDVGYYDRSQDFAGLADPEVLEGALSVYGDDDLLRRKIALRRTILPIVDLPFYVGKGDERGVAEKIAGIRAVI
ncbi:phosphotransferase family enzyme [Herbihabitans rhizosphaerae]|uniref:Phosphotransferase family enzyme n=1 Tax=Herbihabitans rhizosphaerae TaxID=1872711 RepID=A0A4Q7L6X8_9PSEU|nr:aminoglycoside phosphotransferase family protein [Herbihabitans rhizosphaerae]RZS45084.1 phosphotransferase family enzyme [Herbihabitans rhizosphaerae]